MAEPSVEERGPIKPENWHGDDGEMKKWMLHALKMENGSGGPLLRVTEFADRMFAAAVAAERERDRLREYAWHKHSCYTGFPRPEGIPCTCGYEAALEGGPGD